MLAPKALEATSWPSEPIAAVTGRVVVVFPLVPVTSTICRPTASCLSRSGATRRPTTPPMTDPSPRPVSRDTLPAASPRVVATRARIGSLLMAADAIRLPDPARPLPDLELGQIGQAWQRVVQRQCQGKRVRRRVMQRAGTLDLVQPPQLRDDPVGPDLGSGPFSAVQQAQRRDRHGRDQPLRIKGGAHSPRPGSDPAFDRAG